MTPYFAHIYCFNYFFPHCFLVLYTFHSVFINVHKLNSFPDELWEIIFIQMVTAPMPWRAGGMGAAA